MKQLISLAGLFLVIATGAHASLGHLPSNVAYSVSAYARILGNELSATKKSEFTKAIAALTDVSDAYDALGHSLEIMPHNPAETDMLFMAAQITLNQFLQISKNVSIANQRLITAMLAHNDRLLTLLP